MANVPIPLFCSTPPPIDDETDASHVNDDDEDFGDFADAYQENLNNYMDNTGNDEFEDFHSGVPQFLGHILNDSCKTPITEKENDLTEPNIPRSNLNCDSINAQDIEMLKQRKDINRSIREGDFCSQLTQNHTTSLSSLSEQQTSSATSISPVSKSPQPSIETGLDDDEKDFGDFQFDKSIDVAKSDSGRSTENDSVSHDAFDKHKEQSALNNIVLMEDVIDDSSDDERHSPRNRNNMLCDESSSDFFAIHPVDDVVKTEGEVEISLSEAEEKQHVVSECETFTKENISKPGGVTNAEGNLDEPVTEPIQRAKKSDTNLSNVQELDTVNNITTNKDLQIEEETVLSPNTTENLEELDDDFANFQDFSIAPPILNTWPTSFNTETQDIDENHKLSEPYGNAMTQEPKNEVIECADDDNDVDDDDFGDFSEAPVTPISQHPTTNVKQSLDLQLKSILELMFPRSSSTTENSGEEKTLQQLKNTIPDNAPIELEFVESAKALEYQWPGSFVRHEFIRSLGIDSRNIFLTEKWNPAMPRFAANLSFDPLQPLKPTSAPLQPETVTNTTNSSKLDVPVAEFDWKSSGLVNPLDASHVHTLLLDVDQLVVVANLDNINLDSSSSSCSQSSTTTSSSTITTITTTSSSIITTSTLTMPTASLMCKNDTNNINGTMVTHTETTSTKMMSKTHKNIVNNGPIAKTFHGDNLELNSIAYNTTLCTNSNTVAADTDVAYQCRIPDNIIDLDDTGNVLLSTAIDITSQNTCNIPQPSHYHNNNNNANTSLDALNVIDTMRFDASITNASVSAFNLLLPTTSVAFTNNLQFNELHHSLAAQISSNLTPIPSSSTTIITTTTTTTTTKPTITEFTNIVHHFEKMQMQMQMSTNLYREPRPQTEMARESIDASKAESRFSSANENDSNENSSGAYSPTETSTIAASTATGTLSSTLSGGGNIDSTDNDFNHNTDIRLYDMLSSKSNTQLPKEIPLTDTQSFDLNEIQSKNNEVLETIGCTTTEAAISLDVFSIDGDAEVRIENGVISRSTFAGPLKETHIFTPSKNVPDLYEKNMTTLSRTASPATGCSTKVFPIDFDYEKAAAGIIIDETVVHKEYRDIEYNPGFGLESGNFHQRVESPVPKTLTTLPNTLNKQQPIHDDIDDEFTDFQSVPPPEPMRTIAARSDKLPTPTPTNGMILSPAILLPQAISMESKQPKIEWGDSAANIDPDELARIEQLFPQDNNSRNSSKKSTPTHTAMQSNSLSISGTIANKTQQHIAEDDDWSDFVSVPVQVPTTNKNIQRSPKKSRQEVNDDEWSDFVSSTPNAQATIANVRPAPQQNSYGRPQFNSASWQNANFYNNPLSIYHRNQVNAVPNVTPTKLQNNNYSNHNNNNQYNNYNHSNINSNINNSNSNSNNNFTQYLPKNPSTQQLPQQQKIQVMQDFSTGSSDFTPYRPIPQGRGQLQSNYMGPTSSHFQVGSAKVAPTVSLIPDLGFVAPSMPVHTAIINALPKPNSNTKK